MPQDSIVTALCILIGLFVIASLGLATIMLRILDIAKDILYAIEAQTHWMMEEEDEAGGTQGPSAYCSGEMWRASREEAGGA